MNSVFVDFINETIVHLTWAILCHTVQAWRTGVHLDPLEFKSDTARCKSLRFSESLGQDVYGSQISPDLVLQRRNTWHGFPEATQELILQNLS